jgi:carbonic anhydrase
MVYSDDLNCLSVLQYAIEVLKVKYVILCGHYGCGGVRAVVESNKLGEADAWLNSIREISAQNLPELRKIKRKSERIDRLCELNVLQQAQNVRKIRFVQKAMKKGHLISVHAWIYNLRDGLIKELHRHMRK